MNLDEVKQMLLHIEARDRRPFPQGAAEAWLEDFEAIPAADAFAAVKEHFRLREDSNRSTVLPGTIRRRALELAEARGRVQRQAIARGQQHRDPPSAAYRAALADLAHAVGNPERLHRRPDTASPTLVGDEAAEFEANRQRYLAALRAA